MEKRTVINLVKHPGAMALALDRTMSFIKRERGKYQFDGYVTSKEYDVSKGAKQQHNRPVTFAVEALENGVIPTQAYGNLVSALKYCRQDTKQHPIRVVYDSNLDITDWHLRLRVEGLDSLRRAA